MMENELKAKKNSSFDVYDVGLNVKEIQIM